MTLFSVYRSLTLEYDLQGVLPLKCSLTRKAMTEKHSDKEGQSNKQEKCVFVWASNCLVA